LILCGALVLGEAAAIITINTQRGYWELTNKFHILSAVFYLIYLTAVIYSSVEATRSNNNCDLLWRICATLYMAVTMCVYSFYWAKSRLINTIKWKGRKLLERIVIISIALMLPNLCFFWFPNKSVQYNGFMKDGECYLEKRPWIGVMWVTGDTVVSLLLLLLFIKPLLNINTTFRETPESIATTKIMRQMTERNRNLLLVTVLVTLAVIIAGIVGNLKMRTVIYLCAIDRLVTLQCVTMTFSYEQRRWYYCYACFILYQGRKEESEYDIEVPVGTMPPDNKLPSVLIMPIQSQPTLNKNSSSKLSLSGLSTSSNE